MDQVFISYRHTSPDQELAIYLASHLRQHGLSVFIDTQLLVGDKWVEEIDRQVRASSFFIILLSADSIRSDMVRQEAELGCSFQKSVNCERERLSSIPPTAVGGLFKTQPSNTPVGQQISVGTVVTVTDPRHPLYGQSFSVNGTVKRPGYGRCYVVWLPSGLERHIPITATSFSPAAADSISSPLSVTSILNLLAVYARFSQSSEERTNYGKPPTAEAEAIATARATESTIEPGLDRTAHQVAGSLVHTESATTDPSVSTSGQGLLPAGQRPTERGGVR